MSSRPVRRPTFASTHVPAHRARVPIRRACVPIRRARAMSDEPSERALSRRAAWRQLHERLGKSLILAKAMVTPGVTLGVRALVVDSLRGVLLVRHTYMPGFHLPGGGVDPGESAREAALRELLEETGVAAEHAELVGLYFNKSLGNRDHVAVFAVTRFVCPPGGTLTTSREIAEAGFFPLDDLPAATTAPTRRRLKEYLSGAAPAEIW
jgi:ADP-ribose pyrophosphatase YjhB (NUDIX family)